ncbi:hypothetical protein BD769DRAFT_132873 [Suillus cothurnatus]|nr:hypothetical protein BD769DRAFT_132873 [Suillus cothurnatus]
MPQIPAWKERLQWLHPHPPLYEASWYGPIDKLANHIFADDYSMVKSQAKIRPSPLADKIDDPPFEDEGLSIDSMGAQVVTGTFFEPDFIIVLVDDDRDVPLVCIEVKKESESFMTSAFQIQHYTDLLAKKQPHEEFVAILVLGGKFYSYSVSGRRARSPRGAGWETSEDLEQAFEKVAKRVLKAKGKANPR